MDPWQAAAAGLGAAVVLLAFWVRRLRRRLRVVRTAARSQATRHGQTVEQFVPFLRDWPWDPKQFRFLGAPIDGIQFTPDGVVFVEIKTGKSTLSRVQREVRDHVEAGRVHWKEVRL